MARGDRQAGLRWVKDRLVPYRLVFDWWVKQAGCAESVIAALVDHAAKAPQSVREMLKLEFDPAGRVTAFEEPMLVVRLE